MNNEKIKSRVISIMVLGEISLPDLPERVLNPPDINKRVIKECDRRKTHPTSDRESLTDSYKQDSRLQIYGLKRRNTTRR